MRDTGWVHAVWRPQALLSRDIMGWPPSCGPSGEGAFRDLSVQNFEKDYEWWVPVKYSVHLVEDLVLLNPEVKPSWNTNWSRTGPLRPLEGR